MATREDNLNKIREDLKKAEKELESLSDDQLAAIAGGASDYIYGAVAKYSIGQPVRINKTIDSFWDGLVAFFTGAGGSLECCGTITTVEKKDGKWIYGGDNLTQGGKFFNIDEKYIQPNN